MLTIGRPAADRAGARPYHLTFILDSSELLGQRETARRYGRIPRRRPAGGALLATPAARQAEALMREAKAGAFAYNCERQRLEPSLTIVY